MQKTERKRNNIVADLVLNYKTLIILAFLCVVAALISPNFLTARNLTNVVRQICASAVIGIGFTLIIASGNLDLSVGTMLGLLGVIMAILNRDGMPLPLVLLIGVCFGALFGFLNGVVGVKFKLPLFIVTLATGQVFKGACYLISNTSPISGLSKTFKAIGQGYFLHVPIPIYIMVVVAVIMYVVLNRTSFGRYAIATGGNREAARTSGINVEKITVLVYVLMGVCTAIAAMIMTGRAASAQPIAGQGMEMDAIAAVVIGGTPLNGGTGKVVGTLLGCLIVGVISNALNLAGIDSNWQLIAKGLLIVFAVLVDVISANYFTNKLKRI